MSRGARLRGLPARHPFLFAGLLGMAGVLATTGWNQWQVDRMLARVAPKPLLGGVAVSTQLQTEALPALSRHYVRVVDLRPDGESDDEPDHQRMGAAAQAARVRFSYVPVPHGDIPESAVLALRAELADAGASPTLLYCRSGRRAARTWALAEAGLPGGPAIEDILAAVKAAGQDAEDLRPRLQQTWAARAAASQPRP